MANGSSEITLYVDDIPMRLSEKFRPLDFSAIIKEPDLIPEVAQETYNFQAELFALETAELREKVKLEQLATSFCDQKLSSDTQTSDSNASDSDHQTVPALREEATKSMAVHNSVLSGEILMPQKSKGTTNICDYKSENNDKKNEVFLRKMIDPADFESITSSPFDNVELQTIDDMRELNSVFQAVLGSKSVNRIVSTSDKTESPDNRQLHVNVTNSGSVVTPMNGVSVNLNHCASSGRAYDVNSQLSANHWPAYRNHLNYSQQQTDFPIANSQPLSTSTGLRSSKSVSDLPTLCADQPSTVTPKERSQTPPCSYESNKRHVRSRETLILSDPFDELSSASKEFVSKISVMGFDKSRVARAVRHLREDDKKVLDFLLLVQSLEDEGYESCEAEIALHMNNYQYLNARRFLDSLKQLSEVGFGKEAAVKALIKCDNDRDRALDVLLSQ